MDLRLSKKTKVGRDWSGLQGIEKSCGSFWKNSSRTLLKKIKGNKGQTKEFCSKLPTNIIGFKVRTR